VREPTSRTARREKVLEQQRRHGAVPSKPKMYFYTALGVITVFAFALLLADLMRA
jgi:uncharacterized membrane protein YidH (DUF202 family)